MNIALNPTSVARTTRPGRRRDRLSRSVRAVRRPPAKRLPAVFGSEPVRTVRPESASGDSLQLYLNEIGQVALLTPKAEVALARWIQRGDLAAREHMIKANLRLVVKIAREYEGLGVPLLDLINEGNIGLMKGVERFNPGKGAKLSTYAALWIKQQIRRALSNQSKTIRLPVHVVDKVAQLRRVERKLRETLERDPTDEELAHDLQISDRRVAFYRQVSRTPVSLDAPIGDDESNRIADVVADPNAAAPFAQISLEADTQLVREVMTTLTERESKILTLRFGLEDGTQRSLEDIGERFDLTRERIRQIQEQALGKLRAKMEARDDPLSDDPNAFAMAV